MFEKPISISSVIFPLKRVEASYMDFISITLKPAMAKVKQYNISTDTKYKCPIYKSMIKELFNHING